MADPDRAALAMFAKAPRAGKAKTRLAPALTAAGAARFHRECALATWERVARLGSIDAFWYCDLRWPEFEAAAGPDRFRLQGGADLGERMRNCLDELLGDGYRRALLVGSDAPTLPLALIGEALDALGAVDVVLGPAEDGGFALIGAARTEPGMFRDVAWSREDTRAACLAAMRRAGLRAAVTRATAYDIDSPDQLERLRGDPRLPARLRRWFDARAARASQ